MPGSELTVLTLNAYLGAELDRILTATSPAEVIDAAAAAWRQVIASNIPERAEAIAEQITASRADLVGLQEVVQWHCGSPDALRLEFDFLELILDAIHRRGSFYVPLAVSRELDQTAPITTAGEMIRLIDRHTVLLRIDPSLTRVRPYNIHYGPYTTLMPLTILGVAMAIRRSWIAVDASLGSAKFRFIETHLESFDVSVQSAQAAELMARTADCDLPVIIIGDFNSNADQNPNGPDRTPTYAELIAAGCTDVWNAVNPRALGYTGIQASDLRNPESSLDRRIDLVLTRGQVNPVAAKLLGATRASKTASGLWPSDHAGVLATVRIE